MKEALSKEGIKFASVDISSGMLPLKQFLSYRDAHEAFAGIKEEKRVGLPCIVVNKGEKIYFGLPENLEELK